MARGKTTIKISLNSPVVLTFAFICLLALILGQLTGGRTTNLLFSEYHSSLLDPFTYIRFVGHVFGHAGWDHFISNMMLFLVVGPMLEEKYGSGRLLMVILVTAVATGVVNYILFPNVQMLGASGVVFAFILLSSITSLKDGSIPLTFILVAVMYIGQQVYQGIFIQDNIANLAHIIGGAVGAIFGFAMNRHR
jgi:GlpG protein